MLTFVGYVAGGVASFVLLSFAYMVLEILLELKKDPF